MTLHFPSAPDKGENSEVAIAEWGYLLAVGYVSPGGDYAAIRVSCMLILTAHNPPRGAKAADSHKINSSVLE